MLGVIALLASLNVFKETSMAELTLKSRLLTGYLEVLLEENLSKEACQGKEGGATWRDGRIRGKENVLCVHAC